MSSALEKEYGQPLTLSVSFQRTETRLAQGHGAGTAPGVVSRERPATQPVTGTQLRVLQDRRHFRHRETSFSFFGEELSRDKHYTRGCI